MHMTWQPDADTLSMIRQIALQNAVEYEGKAAVGSVIGRIMAVRADLRQYGKDITDIVVREVTIANELAQLHGIEHLVQLLQDEAPHLLEKRETKARREGLPPLSGAEQGKVVLRFAPNPNGPLSFGHARGVVINSAYREMYDGIFILRFDDTDTKVKPPIANAYQQIVKETEWLTGRKPDRVVIASDRIEEYYRYAHQMLEGGIGYVCLCEAETFKDYRVSGNDCPCRDQTAEKNVELWELMLDGTYAPGDAVVRVKTDMKLTNPALRDWPALRIQDTKNHPHPRSEIGSKYTVWPLLDFQSAIEDHLQGVTHIIRGKDLMDSTRKQTLLYQHFGWKYPETMYWGRVKVHEWGRFSTSQMRSDIEAGIYQGWTDPRLPTLGALKERGIQPAALRTFWLELGVTQKDISVPLATLYAHNTKEIDNTAPRLSFIRQPIALSLAGKFPTSLEIPIHPNHEGMGLRNWKIDDGRIWIESEDRQLGKIRLKEYADVSIQEENAFVSSLTREDERPIVHWLSAQHCHDCTLIETKDNERIEWKGLLENHAYATGTIVQLERIGYARLLENGTFVLCHETAQEE